MVVNFDSIAKFCVLCVVCCVCCVLCVGVYAQCGCDSLCVGVTACACAGMQCSAVDRTLFVGRCKRINVRFCLTLENGLHCGAVCYGAAEKKNLVNTLLQKIGIFFVNFSVFDVT